MFHTVFCNCFKVDPKKGIYLVYAAGHCHAPSCISLELWNADTGHLICRNEPVTFLN